MAACNSKKENELTPEEKQAGWVLLFDGKSTDGWHLYNHAKTKSSWQVVDGILYCSRDSKDTHGDLITDEAYENFDLQFEWRLQESGNSGVFINVQENDSLPNTWSTGPEYQLLDLAHPDDSVKNKRAGCMFGFSPQLNTVNPNTGADWNTSRIKQENGKVEFYLNGVLTTKEDFKSPEWRAKINASPFKSAPQFGKYTSGNIALQEWAKGISFKNIKVKKL